MNAFKRGVSVLMSLLMLICSVAQYALPVGADSFTTTPDIAVGYGFAAALAFDGSVWSWGCNTDGQLGAENINERSMADKIETDKKFVAIAAGYAHMLALTSDGTVYAWGDNSYGQLGQEEEANEERKDLSTPTLVQGLSSISVIAIAAGRNTSFALTATGEVFSWGSNESGMLGIGKAYADKPFSTSPMQITAWGSGEAPFIGSIYTGELTAAAIAANGKVWLWGESESGQVGDSASQEDHIAPFCKGPTTDYQATCVAIGAAHTAILKADGSIATIGKNENGEFGSGASFISNNISSSITSEKSTALIDSAHEVTEIVAGRHHTVAMTKAGKLLAWGNLTFEATTNTPTSTPTEISVVADAAVTQIAAAYQNIAAIDSEGHVYVWGDNQFGQIGNGTPVEPIEIAPCEVMRDAESRLYLGLAVADVVQNVFVTATATVPSPTFSVTIPATIDFGTLEQKTETAENRIKKVEFTVKAADIRYLFGESIVIRVAPATGTNFVLTATDGSTLPYHVYNLQSGGTALIKDATFASFDQAGTVTGRIEIDQSTIEKEASYSGSLMFRISTESSGS